ncbi:unnamed protein product [Zymoseptoria tritici ST99CH_1A5]|uniref:Uncharacterized protein n=3 Tax=Zymoseptoria tritici TaxID=1047171 RepID=A0A1X7RME0_ZYMT9|nr:unnamed protein product [Zymoseptoria tritici ST99CH_3D7]SMR48364.1 unnamed protein product [Zymoseptoria tritici ST99CH_1E4]SMR49575.1 unnamed protein product [Zymoseptoria tritici ST99CH_3D1]SMY22273.1 unnamed protein product [Zymoseptoria tritici ST99CH_1A5]
MPSIEESKRQVKAGLASQRDAVDHDAILASLEAEIDRHNGMSKDRSRSGGDDEKRTDDGPSTRFRFKSGTPDPRKRKRSSREHGERRHRKHRHKSHDPPQEDGFRHGAAHPFAREPVTPTHDGREDPSAAFRDSLFDALADDEGAAYWESVYSQPIHVYPRPTIQTPKGELEEMNDEQYAAYVQMRMWEKKNPQIVLERERKEKQKREDEEERVRKREEFIRRKERAAWERSHKDGASKFAGLDSDGEDDYEYVIDPSGASKRSTDGSSQDEYRNAWSTYLAAWDKLKLDLEQASNVPNAGDGAPEPVVKPAKRIPWPVLESKPATRPNIESFMRNAPRSKDGPTIMQTLKSERVKWHPDKIQQRFRGGVDEGTMKVVTGIFHVVDDLLEAERKREQG